MATTAIDPNILKRAQAWLDDNKIDAETKTRISNLICLLYTSRCV